MTNCLTSYQIVLPMFNDSNINDNELFCNSYLPEETTVFELENALRKQKAAAEKNAKLMQLIWGDSFQSDSLH